MNRCRHTLRSSWTGDEQGWVAVIVLWVWVGSGNTRVSGFGGRTVVGW